MMETRGVPRAFCSIALPIVSCAFLLLIAIFGAGVYRDRSARFFADHFYKRIKLGEALVRYKKMLRRRCNYIYRSIFNAFSGYANVTLDSVLSCKADDTRRRLARAY